MAAAIIGPKFYGWDDNGDPLAYGKLYTYQPGTTTPKPTYTNEDGLVENTNPVILNAAGWADVHLEGSYAMLLTDADDNEIWSADTVTDAADQINEWIKQKDATYVSPNSFKVNGNETETFSIGRAVLVNDVVEKIGSVTSAEFLAGETTVVLSIAEPITTSIDWVRVGIFTEASFPQSALSLNSILSVADFAGIANPQDNRQISMKGWAPGTDKGNGILYFDSSIPKSEHDGGLTFSPTVPYTGDKDDYRNGIGETDPGGTGCWHRLDVEYVTPEMFGGLGDNSQDNTTVYDAIINSQPDGTKIRFETQGTYLGNFVSEEKSFDIDLNGATITDTDDNTGIMQIGGFNADEYNVSESTLENGDTQFTVSGASGLFNVGDIGYLWDQAVRPTGGSVNFETVKIADITGDVITVDGFLASYKGASGIKFYHSAHQLKNPSIKNGFIKPSATHVSFGVACLNCENVAIRRVQIEGAYGNAVAARYCYDVDIEKIKPLNPRATGSGQGYGVALLGISQFRIRDVIGLANRHVYDQDSAYFGDIENVSDMDDQSSPVTLAHNGFAGYLSCKNIRTKTSQYPIVFSEQGYGGSPGADKSNHFFRNIVIDGVDATMRDSVSPDSSNIVGVYFQNSVKNVDVRNVISNLLSSASLTTGNGVSVVRVNGIALGYFNIDNVECNKAGKALFSNGDRDGLSYDGCITKIRNIKLGECGRFVFVQGLWAIDADVINTENTPIEDQLVYLELKSGDNPVGGYIGSTVNYNFSSLKRLLETTGSVIDGSLPLTTRATGTSIAVAANDALTIEDLQNRSSWVRLTSPVGVSTTTLSATEALPPPQINGAELFISQPNAGRNAVEFPAGNNIWAAFTIGVEETVRVVSYSGKWRLTGRYSAV